MGVFINKEQSIVGSVSSGIASWQRRINRFPTVPACPLSLPCISRLAKKTCIQIEFESTHMYIYYRRLFKLSVQVFLRVLQLNLTTYHLASSIDPGADPIASESLPMNCEPILTIKSVATYIRRRKIKSRTYISFCGLPGTAASMGLYLLRMTSSWQVVVDSFSRDFQLWGVCRRHDCGLE